MSKDLLNLPINAINVDMNSNSNFTMVLTNTKLMDELQITKKTID